MPGLSGVNYLVRSRPQPAKIVVVNRCRCPPVSCTSIAPPPVGLAPARTGWRCCLLSSPRWVRLLARHANRYQARAQSSPGARQTHPLDTAHATASACSRAHVPPPDLAYPRPGARHLPHDPNLLRHRPAAPRLLPHGPNPPPAPSALILAICPTPARYHYDELIIFLARDANPWATATRFRSVA